MNLEQTVVALQSRNEQLDQENDLLKSTLSVFKENMDLRARLHCSDETLEEVTGYSVTERHPSSLWKNSLKRQFKKGLQQNRSTNEQRTSSPVDFKSFIQNSVHTDVSERAEGQSCQSACAVEVKGQERLMGEIAYQLDRRILCYVFQSNMRFYGFTLRNIPEKIREVSTHPLTGKLDEGYQLHLTQRYTDLKEKLNRFGYKATLHPPFTEFIVNTYGILKERTNKNKEIDYNNPDFLRRQIMITAPRQLHKDLLLVLTCLCSMANEDRKPLILW